MDESVNQNLIKQKLKDSLYRTKALLADNGKELDEILMKWQPCLDGYPEKTKFLEDTFKIEMLGSCGKDAVTKEQYEKERYWATVAVVLRLRHTGGAVFSGV